MAGDSSTIVSHKLAHRTGPICPIRGPLRAHVGSSELRPFSDVWGRHTIRLTEAPDARDEIARRLENAGCPVRRAGGWLHAGGFGAALATKQVPRYESPERDLVELLTGDWRVTYQQRDCEPVNEVARIDPDAKYYVECPPSYSIAGEPKYLLREIRYDAAAEYPISFVKTKPDGSERKPEVLKVVNENTLTGHSATDRTHTLEYRRRAPR